MRSYRLDVEHSKGSDELQRQLIAASLAINYYFSGYFLVKIPCQGNTFLFCFSPPSSPSGTLEGLFELTQRPSRALNLPRALLPELKINNDTIVRCAAPGDQDTVKNTSCKP